MTCPVCNSHSSSVLSAVNDDRPCPSCGTPASVILEVDALRSKRGDEQLKRRVEELMIELGKVTAERDQLRRVVDGVRLAIDDDA
jgi:hypothetical protein